MEQYLKEQGLELNEMKVSECHQIFRFGPSKQHVSRTMVELLVIVRRMDGNEDVLKVFTYLVDADVPFLCGKRTMVEKWNSKIDTKGNHVAIEIERKNIKEEEIFFSKEGEKLDTFKAIRKVHEVTNHKSAEQLILSYRNAGIIGPEIVKLIRQVVKDCKTH